MKKSNFLSKLLALCLLCLVGSLANAQSLTRVKPAPAPSKPAVAKPAPVNFAQPAPGFNPSVGIITNVPKLTTEAEKRAYGESRKNVGKTTTQVQSTSNIAAAEKAAKGKESYAKLQAYEAMHLQGVDVSTPAGHLKRMEVQKAFYLANGDTASAAKVDAAIKSATK